MDLIDLAENLKQRGMSLADAAQDFARPNFRTAALNAIRVVALRQEFVHVDDVLNEIIERPEHPNCWGSIWTQAAKNDWIVMTDRTRQSADPRKHRHRSPVYRSLIFGKGRA